MFRRLLGVAVMFVLALPVISNADYYLIICEMPSHDFSILQDYPDRSWGSVGNKVYLAGSENEFEWLDNHSIEYRKVEISEPKAFYLCRGNPDDFAGYSEEILDSGRDYVLSKSKLPEAESYRVLKLRKLPFVRRIQAPELVVEYDPVIAGMIAEVTVDTLRPFLRGLSGEDPVMIGGSPYTLNTRYTGTDDNLMAAQYLLETLQGYGYDAEYHNFFNETPRHVVTCDENLAFFVTENGGAFRTANGGTDWESVYYGSTSLWGIATSGPDSVWITGDGGTIRFSSDGGNSFSMQNSGTSYFLFGTCFINNNEGWVAADNGRILRTVNAGQLWVSQNTPTGSRLYDVCFIDSNNGWAVGRDGSIIHTTNGGANWTGQTSGTSQRLYSVEFTDINNGWTVGWGGVVRRTTNGGSNWTAVSLGTSSYMYHVDFVNASDGWIVGWGGEIYRTTDRGDTWTRQNSGTGEDFYGVGFADTQYGYAVGNSIVERTTDGGATWINQSGNVEGSVPNVIATKTGTVSPDEEVIICGHFDSISESPQTRAPGADDNGSGATAVIDAARIFADYDLEKTIKFCLWNGEEQGLLGSAAYAAEAYARGDNIVGVYNYDMIAYEGNGDDEIDLHVGTMSSSQAIADIVVDVVDDYDLNLVIDYITYGATDRSDHASFWEYGYAAILGIEDMDDFNPYYHSTGDNVSHIVWDYFEEFTRAAVGATATYAVPVPLSDLTVNMIPDNPPIIVPAGGSFTYTGSIANNTGQSRITDVWLMLTLPNGNSYGPVDRYNNFRLNPYQSVSIQGIRQDVPNYAPIGSYDYISYCGDYPYNRVDSASFGFTVTAGVYGRSQNWDLSGWTAGDPEIKPDVLMLGENYPDPFNASTNIEFSLPADADVSLKVYNLLGQEVETLIDGMMDAGINSVSWNASGYASGVYFYKLTAGDKTVTKRMTLLK